MPLKLQKIPNYPLHNLYHRGLIKIPIVYHLRKKKITWDRFLREEGFGSINSRRKVGRPKKKDIHEKTSVAPVSRSSPSSPKNPMSKNKEKFSSSSWSQPKKKNFMAEELVEVNPGILAPKPIFLPVEVKLGKKISNHIPESSHQV